MQVSNHALNRMIERNILCKNIKPNKKQIKKNRKKALKKIDNELEKYFAYSISDDKNYKYLYSDLTPNGFCKKYIVHIFSDRLITVINRIDFNNEIKKTNIYLKKLGNKVSHEDDIDKVYKNLDDNKFIFIVTPYNRVIKSFSFDSFDVDKIINDLICGKNPFTGEMLDDNHLLNDERIKKALIDMKTRTIKQNNNKDISSEDLTENEHQLFDMLDNWRKDKTIELNREKYILSDRVLFNIIKKNIKSKEELLNINGIDTKKYEDFADEIFFIISSNRIYSD